MMENFDEIKRSKKIILPSSCLGEDGSSSLKATGCLSHGVARNSLRDASALKQKDTLPPVIMILEFLVCEFVLSRRDQ